MQRESNEKSEGAAWRKPFRRLRERHEAEGAELKSQPYLVFSMAPDPGVDPFRRRRWDEE
jgi:hypothetical protein